MIFTLGEKQQAIDTTKLFRTDAIIDDQLVNLDQPPRILASYMRRSPFNILRVRQFNVGLQQSHFVPTDRFLKHMDDSTACVVSSKVVEGLNNYQNHASQDSSWGSIYRRPQTARAATTNAQLLYIHCSQIQSSPRSAKRTYGFSHHRVASFVRSAKRTRFLQLNVNGNSKHESGSIAYITHLGLLHVP